MYGFDEDDIPAGYHDADLEMRELEKRGNELARSIRSKPQVSVTIGGTTFYGAPEMLEVPGYGDGDAPPSSTMSTSEERAVWTIAEDGYADGGTPYTAEELADIAAIEALELDEHENGQLRLGAEGDQLALMPLPAEEIPSSDGPPLVSPAVAELEGYAVERQGSQYVIVRRGRWPARVTLRPAYGTREAAARALEELALGPEITHDLACDRARAHHRKEEG